MSSWIREREADRERAERRGGRGWGGWRGDDKVFHCSRCVCVDRTLLYLHKARAGCTLWDSRRCTEEDFLDWLIQHPTLRDITFSSDGRHQIPSPCCDFSLISSVSCQLCQAKQICSTSEGKKRGGGDLLEQSGALLHGWKKSAEEKGGDAMWYGAFKGADLSQIRDSWEAILYPHGQSWAPSSTANTKVLLWLDLLFTLFLVPAQPYSSYSSLPLDVCFLGQHESAGYALSILSEKQHESLLPVRCIFNAGLFTQIKISDGKCCETVDLMDVRSAGAAAARTSGTP